MPDMELSTTPGNTTRLFSPVTLYQGWPTLSRLVLLVLFATSGTIINGFFVASFFVERTLNKVGNVYLACVGLSDLLITAVVMPTSAVVLLSGQWDVLPVCRSLQFFTEVSTYCYSLYFVLVAAETHYRLCRSHTEYQMFLSHVCFLSVLVFILSVAVAAIGVYMQLDYDYCQREYRGSFFYRATTLGVLHALPFFMTMFGLLSSVFCINRRARMHKHYRRSQQYDRDCSTTNLNIVAYLLYVTGWIPYVIVIHDYPSPSDSRYYYSIWFGLLRSVVTSMLYCGMNTIFRRSFGQLFYYCCCKSSLTDRFATRHRRTLEYKPTTGDVRVHIMHQVVSSGSPQRSLPVVRETLEL